MQGEAQRQLSLPLVGGNAMGRTDFHVAPCNADALAWLDRWPDWPSPSLLLSGPAGCGKTHLAHIFAARVGARFIDSARLSVELEAGLDPAIPAWIVDSADVGLDADRETALFHLINWLAETGRSLVLTGTDPAARWPVKLADLGSRLRAMAAVRIEAPDEIVLAGVLVKMFADRQIRVAPDLIAYLLPRMERSFQEARRLVAQLDRLSLEEKRPVTIPLARRVLP